MQCQLPHPIPYLSCGRGAHVLGQRLSPVLFGQRLCPVLLGLGGKLAQAVVYMYVCIFYAYLGDRHVAWLALNF